MNWEIGSIFGVGATILIALGGLSRRLRDAAVAQEKRMTRIETVLKIVADRLHVPIEF